MILMMDWVAQKGPNHPKHHGWHHPIATCLLHYAVVGAVSWSAHDVLVIWFYQDIIQPLTDQELNDGVEAAAPASACPYNSTKRWYATAAVLLLYSAWLFIWRLLTLPNPAISTNNMSQRAAVLYEYCWLCNVTLILSALALLDHRPIIAQAFCATVGIDQLLWYLDLLVYFSAGFFPIGVSKYLFWPGTSWTVRITSTHHLWTIPLLLWTTRGIHWLALPLSLVLMVTNVLLSRWMIPSHLATTSKHSPDNQQQRYLNVNLSYELWPDVKISLIQINYDNPPMGLYLFRLWWRWGGFNAVVFAVLYWVCYYWFGPNVADACMVDRPRLHNVLGFQ